MTPELTIGELFSGYGGLGLGVQQAIGGRVIWHSDIDPGACKILAHRYPDAPNHGDITRIDWSTVERPDVLTGGSPCQDLSHAGRRAGMTDGTRSNLWVAMREAIAQLRPGLVVWENVRGAYGAAADSAVEPCPGCVGDRPGVHLRALGRVLGDLSDLGYDAIWHGLRASDIGAPHGRFRVFALAWDRAQPSGLAGIASAGSPPLLEGQHHVGALLPTPTSRDWKGHNQRRDASCLAGALLPLEGKDRYATAIARWETETRPAPPPTETGPKRAPRLSARFSEWLMGLPDGWITDVPGITRTEALKACGNGVVPQQAAAAVRWMADRLGEQVAA